MLLSHVITGGELSSCSQLDTNKSAQLLDAARSLGEDEAAAATAVAATAAGEIPGMCQSEGGFAFKTSPVFIITDSASCNHRDYGLSEAAACDLSGLQLLEG